MPIDYTEVNNPRVAPESQFGSLCLAPVIVMFLRTFSTGNYVYVAFIDDKTLSELYVHAFSIYSIKKDYTLRWTGTMVRIPYPFVCSFVLVWIKLRVCMRKIFHVCVCVCVRVCLSVGRSFCLFVGHSVCLCLCCWLVMIVTHIQQTSIAVTLKSMCVLGCITKEVKINQEWPQSSLQVTRYTSQTSLERKMGVYGRTLTRRNDSTDGLAREFVNMEIISHICPSVSAGDVRSEVCVCCRRFRGLLIPPIYAAKPISCSS